MRPTSLSPVFLVLCTFALSGCAEVPAQDSGGALGVEQSAYDVTHYDLHVRVHPEREALSGRLLVEADVKDSLEAVVLNLDRRLTVTDVYRTGSNRERLSYERRAGGNEIWAHVPSPKAPGDRIQVEVRYEGAPRVAPNPPWEGGVTWSETSTGAPWIATSGQTAGADLWWPVKDHPSDEPDSMDISITVPDSLVAASNGRLRTIERTSDTTQTYRWHVSTSINSYAVTLNVAPYVTVDTNYTSTSEQTVPVTFYVLPSDSSVARTTLPHFLDHVRYLEETLGPYPFRADKYGIAQTPFLGMEHQTLIAYGNGFDRTGGLGYDATFDALHFHELAHEWYGNCVTARDWKDFWLHEGTATYLEALYTESLHGTEAYHERIDYFRKQVFGEAPIARKTPASAKEMYSRDVYYKGALVLHTLRGMIGKRGIYTLLRRFVTPDSSDGPVCRHADTDEFLQVAESVADRSLDGMAETYLYRSAVPRLDSTRADGRLELKWRETGDTPFNVPVPVRVNGELQHVQMENDTGSIPVPTDADLRIDPQGWLLKANEVE